MPRRRNTWWARVTTSGGRPSRSRRGTRRSRCTRISAEVRDSAALIARVIASKSASLRSRWVQLGCFAITNLASRSPVLSPSPAPTRAAAAGTAAAAREPTVTASTAAKAPAPAEAAASPPSAIPAAAGLCPAPPARRVAALVRGFPREPTDGHRHEREQDEQVEVGAPALLASLRRLGQAPELLGGRARLDALEHGDRRRLEPGRVLPLAEAGHDHVADDLRGLGVGQRALEPVADLDPQLSVLDEDDEEDAVVELLLAQAPLLEEAVRDVLEVLAVERFEAGDRHLGAGGALALGQEGLDALALGRGKEPGVVVQPCRRRRRQDEGDGESYREKQTRTSPWARSPRRAPPRRTPWTGSPRIAPRPSPGTAAAAYCSRAPPG